MDVIELIKQLHNNKQSIIINPNYKDGGISPSIRFTLIDNETELAVDINTCKETIFDAPEDMKIIERVLYDLNKGLGNNGHIRHVPHKPYPEFRPIAIGCLGCDKSVHTNYHTPTGSIVDYYCDTCKEKKMMENGHHVRNK